jgi:hypothetical protein
VTQQAARDVNVPARRRPVQRTITQLARRFLVHQAAPRFTPRQCGLAARTLLKLQSSWYQDTRVRPATWKNNQTDQQPSTCDRGDFTSWQTRTGSARPPTLAAMGRASVPGRRPPLPGPRPSGGRRPARRAPARSRRCRERAQPRPRLPAARAPLRCCHPAWPPAACAAEHRRSQLITSFCPHRYAVISWREACSELQDTAAAHGLNLERVRVQWRGAAVTLLLVGVHPPLHCSRAGRFRRRWSVKSLWVGKKCLWLRACVCCLSRCPLAAYPCLSWQADLVATAAGEPAGSRPAAPSI